MENNPNNNHPQPPYPPYNAAYGYPFPAPLPNQYPPPDSGSQPFPPPNLYPPQEPGLHTVRPPPGGSLPYAYPLYFYYTVPYSTPHAGPANYPFPAPSASPAPGPYPYHAYPTAPLPSAPHPSIQTFNSFPHGQFHYPHHQPPGPVQAPDIQPGIPSSVSNSAANFEYPDKGSSTYLPPIDQLANIHLSDKHKSALAPPQKSYSGPLPMTNKIDGKEATHKRSSTSFTRTESPQVSPTMPANPNSPYVGVQLVPVISPKAPSKVVLLHGNFDIWVYEAKNLPNMDMFHKTIGDMFNRLPGTMSSKIEGQIPRKITSDPYVSIQIAGATLGRTFVICNEENPVWMQNFVVPVAHHVSEVRFVVKDDDVVGSQHIGTVLIPAEHICEGGKIHGFFPILNASGKPCKTGAVLSLSIQYKPIEKLSIYHHGIGAGPDYKGVPGTYFPVRRGGTLTLYQDAHVPDGSLPNLKLDNGMQRIHGKCWHDIFDAIRHARRLIYITGWSVWHKVRLIRDDNSLSDYTLGELLKSKSQEGVRVLLLIWDDPTSRSILGYKTDGVMQTHDEETRRFFKQSSVQVLLCPRVAGKRHSWVKQKEVGVIYTHHQKTVIVDADAGNNRRKIVAFVGGLDLCNGRYDTPQHPLFRTLQTDHSDDYHNPTYAGSTAGCPREAWHDLHSKIDGPAAYDVLSNFEERWLKAAKPHGLKKLKMSYDDALLRIERMPDILAMSDAPCVSDDDPEGWHIQVFRSIDSNSVKGFPKDPKDAPKRNLVCGKNVLIDMSIHTAYVEAIRSAQHFIYIENQYFIGSSYNWSQYRDIGANHLIPMEIALKIAEKIREHERFAAYIVLPMWPEGNPTGGATQRILFWQHKTMQMMYETIYKALVEVGLEDAYSPQDFLNFYCLGNREALDTGDQPETQTATNTPQGFSKKNRRFMIYVHSKGMIVDDEYVILGSANINQRSMEGTRDTEIAVGAYQPHHTWARKQSSPHGQVYGYRMSLWAEHIGALEDCFARPESLECVRRVRSLGEANWNQFASPEVSDMKGHLLKYPVEVDRHGKVKPLPGSETFPDVGGNIVGTFIGISENLTI